LSEEALRPLLAANWKMNPVRASDAADLGRGVVDAARNAAQTVDVVILPPFPWLLVVGELVGGTGVGLGAQDCFWEQAGAYTGEVSAAMLSSWCGWVLAGHSERRNQFGETDEWVSLKVRAALSAGLHVILRVGELDEEFEAGQTESVVSRQLRAATRDLSRNEATRLVIAYEPVWAIGTGKHGDPEHARGPWREFGMCFKIPSVWG
jgi:triosephosphate isomerase